MKSPAEFRRCDAAEGWCDRVDRIVKTRDHPAAATQKISTAGAVVEVFEF
jgi:hypothetical protein